MKNERGTSMGHQQSSRTWKWRMGEKESGYPWRRRTKNVVTSL